MAVRVAPVTTPIFAPFAAPSLPPTIWPTAAPRTPLLTAPPRRWATATEANIASAIEVTPRIPNLVIVFVLSKIVAIAHELGKEPRPCNGCLFSQPATAEVPQLGTLF